MSKSTQSAELAVGWETIYLDVIGSFAMFRNVKTFTFNLFANT
jgi:hypothetical protein